MTFVKFSKKYDKILSIKKNFFFENKQNLKSALKINKIYIKQTKRKKCKNCNIKIFSKKFFQHKVDYTVCNKCGHLNGIYEDTKEFANSVYTHKNVFFYKSYSNSYDSRVKYIYIPKVNFLKKILKTNINVLDLGAGAGHFLKALEIKKIKAKGYDTNQDLVSLGKNKLKKNKLTKIDPDKIYDLILKEKQSNVLSMIGFLEHLNEPNLMLNQFKKSKIKYLYISVPLFSLSVFLENSFKNIFPRQLSRDHTHLYTKKSLYYLVKENNFKIVAEWWFGTDFPDLYRSLLNSSYNYDKKYYKSLLDEKLYSVIDKLQNILDKNKICSEVHMILKKSYK